EPAREQAKTPPALPPVAPLSSGSQKAEPTPPPVEPRKVEPRKAEPPVTVEPAVAYRLKLGGLRPFTTRGSSEGNGEKGRDLRYVEAARTGDGDFPTGWAGQTWDQGAEAEFSIGTQAGRTALGARNIQKRSAFLISPDVTFQSPAAHIRFQYLTRAVGEKIVLLKFKVPGHDNTTGLFEIGHFPGTGGEWRTADLTVPLRGHSTVFFEWHTFDEGDDAGVFLAAFEAADEQAMGAEPVLGRFDFTRPAPFAIRSTIDIRPDGSHATRQLSRTGAGEPPPGWSARCWSKDTQMEFFADGTPGIGIRNVRGPGSAMLFSPTLAVPSGLCRVRAEYTAPVRDGLWSIRFKPSGNRNAWDASRPPATAPGEWKTAEFVFDTKGATAGFFEFHSHDVNPDNPVRIRSLVVTQPPAGTPPTPANAPAMVGAAAAAGRPAGPRVYQFEAASVPAFRVTKENSTRTAGEPEQLPRGVYCGCWKKEATGEFRREEVDGAPAFGLANFTEQMSAQFGFELEQPDGLALTLRPGGYRVRLVYMTRAEAHGQVDVQTQDYKTVGRVDLPATGGAWRTATFDFDRAADAPVRLTVDNLSAGEGNTLYFRALEVVELSQ
ncbi:MAG TPA: hypothetical protein VH092_00845, partial [Urbifossiella sp.]|nr:hypothetical protein [Urbifossiella sp.]